MFLKLGFHFHSHPYHYNHIWYCVPIPPNTSAPTLTQCSSSAKNLHTYLNINTQHLCTSKALNSFWRFLNWQGTQSSISSRFQFHLISSHLCVCELNNDQLTDWQTNDLRSTYQPKCGNIKCIMRLCTRRLHSAQLPSPSGVPNETPNAQK